MGTEMWPGDPADADDAEPGASPSGFLNAQTPVAVARRRRLTARPHRQWGRPVVVVSVIVALVALGAGILAARDDKPTGTRSVVATDPIESAASVPPTTAVQDVNPALQELLAKETTSQRNARLKAAAYLTGAAYSKGGLIVALQYDGFRRVDALYGVRALHADWFAQAVRKAQEYVAQASFSRQSLIARLTYDSFTQAQAEAAATAVGL